MNYSPLQYARALHGALAHTKIKERHAVFVRFFMTLARHKATGHLPRIMRALARVERTTQDITDIYIESAAVLSKEIELECAKAFSGKTRIKTMVHPELLAGMAITINDEIFIDATGRRQLERLMATRTV